MSFTLDLPGQAALTEEASFLGRQDKGIGLTREQQVPDLEGFGDPESSTFPRAIEPLQPLDVARHDSVLPEMTFHPWAERQGGTAGQC